MGHCFNLTYKYIFIQKYNFSKINIFPKMIESEFFFHLYGQAGNYFVNCFHLFLFFECFQTISKNGWSGDYVCAYLLSARQRTSRYRPSRRTGGSFATVLNHRINGRNIFRMTHAWILRWSDGNITNQSTPGILTNRFCYSKTNERTISLVFLSMRQLCHTSYTDNILFWLLIWMFLISLLYV